MIKHFYHLVGASCFLLACPFFSYAQFQYLSPEPGSKYHDPNTTITLRNGNQLDETSLLTKHLFRVQGSLSGKHDCKVKLGEKGKTIILKPAQPFAGGETVTVNIAEGMRSSSQQKIHGTSFSFEIRKTRTPEESQLIAHQMRQLYAEESGARNETSARKSGQPGFPVFTIDTNTHPAPGDVFWGNFNFFTGKNDHYCINNSAGDSVFGKFDTTVYNNFDLNKNGYLTVYNDEDSAFVMLDSNYRQIAEYQMGNGYKSDPHEFIIYPDKHHYMLAYDPEIVDMTVYNPSYVSNATVIGCVIQELDSNNDVIFQWRSWDHYSILDGDHVIFSNSVIDYCHANTIFVDDDGNLLFSCRNMSEITKIDRATGDIIWRWGGLNNQFIFIGDDDNFSYQHDVQRIDNGHITLFDNGNYRAPSFSYAKEYMLDEVNKTATLVWGYRRAIGASYVFSKAMGSTQRLPNGNTLICWGLVQAQPGAPKLTEVDTAGNLVWELKLSNEDAVYRAHRYIWEPCARPSDAGLYVDLITSASGKVHWAPATNASTYDLWYRKSGSTKWKVKTGPKTFKKLTNLSPSTLYEYQIRSHCSGIPTGISGFTSLKTFMTAPLKEVLTDKDEMTIMLYPNPANNELQITIHVDNAQTVSVSFYDVTGKEVFHSFQNINTGEQQLQYDVSGLPKGMYVAEMKTAKGRMVQKFVKE